MRCGVCSKDGARPLTLQNGTIAGHGCSDACLALVWELWTVGAWKLPPDEAALIQWQVRRRRAEAAGAPFTEAPPKSQAERELERIETLLRIASKWPDTETEEAA